MIFYLTGTRGGNFGAKIEKKLEKVFELCVLELNLSRFRGVVHARMPRKKGLLEGRFHGLCEFEGKHEIADKNFWWSTIDLANTHDQKELVATLCHEMVHVKQYLRKELSEDGMKWLGKQMPNSKNPLDDPHEEEAYRLEEVLFQKCVDLKLV